MRSKVTICLVLLIITIMSLGCTFQPDGQQQDSSQINNTTDEGVEDLSDIEGIWMGNLTVPGGLQLRIVFNISTNPDGSINASMDSPDQ